VADICTLVSVARTLLMCVPVAVCDPEPDHGKVFCRPTTPTIDCNNTISTFQCKRPDGTTYIFTKEE